MGALFQSRGWLPIVEAPGYLRHPTSILAMQLLNLVNNNYYCHAELPGSRYLTLLCHSSLVLLLAKLLSEELKQPAIPPPTKISPKQAKVSPPEPKIKKEYEDFSDGSDEATTDDMDLESVERLDSYNMGKDQKGTWKNVHLDDYMYLKCSDIYM